MRVFVWLLLVGLASVFPAMGQDAAALRRERDGLVERGLWKDALAFYREKLAPISDEESGRDLGEAVDALEKLNTPKDFDALVEGAVERHRKNPEVLLAAANAYITAAKHGAIVAGNFERGFQGGGGINVSTQYRDKVRSLQLYLEALKLPLKEEHKADVWGWVAGSLISDVARESWEFQILTPLGKLPDWEESGPMGVSETPWKDGPVLYDVPASWEKAKNDGERWRFALAEMAKGGADREGDAVLRRAEFLAGQFGAHTLVEHGGDRNEQPWKEMLESLSDDEVLAKTADGVKRFKLPPDQHFIALYRSVLDRKFVGELACYHLSQIYLIRGQFEKARGVLEESIARFGPGPEELQKKRLQQIVGNWGRFGDAPTVPAGSRPKISLDFRNAKAVRLSATAVDMDLVVNDVLALLESNPVDIDQERLNPSAIARQLIADKKSKYLGEVAAEWVKELEPAAGHRDKNEEIEVPVEKAGAWWITGEMEGGYRFHTLVWVVDTLLNERDIDGSRQWWVSEAASGAPVSGAEIRFFGYQMVNRERKTPQERRMDIKTTSFTRQSDDDGRTVLKPADLPADHEWMVIARKPGRATAFFGFRPIPIREPVFANGNRDISYGITDRPLYRGGDRMHVKFFLRNVGYFEPDEAKFAGRVGTFTLINGRGEEALKIPDLKTDELGAVECEAVIPKDAPLGRWRGVFTVADQISASVTFRVEEFRKPEYEVTIEAPKEPVKLGGKFTAKVKAVYFHGAPVRDAEVKVTVTRTTLNDRWFPAGRWDWLYGKGSWWTGADASWHPGWEDWTCQPVSKRGGVRQRWTPEERVMEKVLRIGPDGSVAVEIDTADAAAKFGDVDSTYRIEAHVTDKSRREESATGEVIAARKPFEVVVWPDRGFAAPGDEIEAKLSAATLMGRSVVGAEGTLKLLKLSVDTEGKVSENEVMSWPAKTGTGGEFSQRFAAPAAGQYRLVASVSLNGGDAVTSATILNVHGSGTASPEDWKFGALELITDKSEYAAGETLKLRINSDRPGAHVWLFLHVGGANGMEVKRVQLDGKSLAIDVPLDRRDMPNMFIEAVTVYGAKVYGASREVLLPPGKKMVEVSVEPEKPRTGPGTKSSLKLRLKDHEGNPVAGKAVVTIYDKSLEAVAGGSNVAAIDRVFWGWKNYRRGPGNSCSIPLPSGNVLEPDVPEMELLGHLSGPVFFGMEMAADPFAAPMAKTMAAAPDPFASDSGSDAAPSPRVRKDFADLLKWQGTVIADAEGIAEVPLEFPDNLTTWKACVWVLGSGTRVGEGSAEIITTKDLLVRLQAPRFLVEKDEAVISAIVHNEHDVEKEVAVSLELEGAALQAVDGKPATVKVAAKGEARVDWTVKAVGKGAAKIRMIAKASDDGDAIERELPIDVNGMLRREAWSRVIDGDATSTKIAFEVPAKLRPEQTVLTVRFSPTVAGAAVDAIPYLASYPHGCTEQTLNRFLPTVIASRMLSDMGIDLAAVKEKRVNLNPQELGDASARAAQWKQWQTNPVFDQDELRRMTREGLEKLVSMQNQDGGWGWFSGFGEKSYPHTTAVVMHGLLVGRLVGVETRDPVYASGLSWLREYEINEIAALKRYGERQEKLKKGEKPEPPTLPEKTKADALDAFVRQVLGQAGTDNAEMLEFLFRDRVDLPVYGQVLLGLEMHRLNDAGRRDEVMTMISQFVKRDAENQTVWLDLRNGAFWWNWYGGEIEANAWYLKLLSAVKPADPETRGLAKYLVNNRKGGSHWTSTRDTAFVIEALAGYVKASGEGAPEMEVEVLVDGKSVGNTVINKDNLFSFDGTVVIAGKAIAPGKHEIEILRKGAGTLYANAYLDVFSLEDRLKAAGLEVKVKRNISRIIPETKTTKTPDQSGIVTTVVGGKEKKVPLEDGATVPSGDRIEVELIFESKNDYEYLIFSDAKAAGFEAVDVLSGYVSSGSLAAYMEPKDRSVDFFIRSLPRGKHVLRYQLRAESPGTYKAMPAVAEAMYAPELRANSDDIRLKVRDR